MKNQEEELVVIEYTTDYEKFKFFKTNRPIDHVAPLKNSIKTKNLTRFRPVLCTEDYYIIDGQNSFMACKELGLPIAYIQSKELQESDMILLNSVNVPWKTVFFIQHFIEKEHNLNYERLNNLLKTTKLNFSTIVKTICKCSDEKFKSGKFIITEQEIEIAKKMNIMFSCLIKAFPKIVMREVNEAMFRFLKIKDLDLKHFEKQTQQHPQLVKRKASPKENIIMFKRIYDYRRTNLNCLFSDDEKEE